MDNLMQFTDENLEEVKDDYLKEAVYFQTSCCGKQKKTNEFFKSIHTKAQF